MLDEVVLLPSHFLVDLIQRMTGGIHDCQKSLSIRKSLVISHTYVGVVELACKLSAASIIEAFRSDVESGQSGLICLA